MTGMIVIVDYGMGNLRSILNKLERLDVPAVISSDPVVIARADRLVLPGVGAFDAAMANLRERGLIPVLNRKVLLDRTPILGICLGMQLFSRFSEEGNAEGLGWIDARTVRLDFGGHGQGHGQGLKVPHMGWNAIAVRRRHPVLGGLDEGACFYFVHSYHVRCDDPGDVLATTRYGLEFTSVVQRDNIIGVQFHPEKSHDSGVTLLRNFVRGEAGAPVSRAAHEATPAPHARVIPCLLLQGDGLVKTVQFKSPTYVGDPINAVRIFNKTEADELIFLDIVASRKRGASGPEGNSKPRVDLISKISDECFMPLSYGGGIRTIEEVRDLLGSGVEKVIINTHAVEDPTFVQKASDVFGSQSIVAAIDARRQPDGRYEVYTHGGTRRTGLDPVSHARHMEAMGAGEIFVNSIDRDGTMQGFDLGLISAVASAVSIPVIACGGAGRMEHFPEAIRSGASAVAAGSFFVFHGRRRAVLINYPTRSELEGALHQAQEGVLAHGK